MAASGPDKLNIVTSPHSDVNAISLIRGLWGEARAAELAPLLKERSGEFDYHILAQIGHKIIGHAKIFRRDILASKKPIKALALSAVFILPDYRGRGYGKKIVQTAFEFVNTGAFEVCMFQTDITNFYARLGARKLGNKFTGKPWTDLNVMIYPAGFDLPGEIDILGEAW